MIERIQPVNPIIQIRKDPKRDSNHSNTAKQQSTTKEITPIEGSPSFLEDDLLRREFSKSKFDVKV